MRGGREEVEAVGLGLEVRQRDILLPALPLTFFTSELRRASVSSGVKR